MDVELCPLQSSSIFDNTLEELTYYVIDRQIHFEGLNKYDDYKICMYNLAGQQVLKQDLEKLIDLPSDLSTGNYLMEISKPTANKTFQIFVND